MANETQIRNSERIRVVAAESRAAQDLAVAETKLVEINSLLVSVRGSVGERLRSDQRDALRDFSQLLQDITHELRESRHATEQRILELVQEGR